MLCGWMTRKSFFVINSTCLIFSRSARFDSSKRSISSGTIVKFFECKVILSANSWTFNWEKKRMWNFYCCIMWTTFPMQLCHSTSFNLSAFLKWHVDSLLITSQEEKENLAAKHEARLCCMLWLFYGKKGAIVANLCNWLGNLWDKTLK